MRLAYSLILSLPKLLRPFNTCIRVPDCQDFSQSNVYYIHRYTYVYVYLIWVVDLEVVS